MEEKKNVLGERLMNGLLKENPTFVLMLGMCPTLAVTTSAINGLGMGLTTAVVLALSNLIISLLRNIIPAKVRIPAFIVIIASFVTVVQLLLQAYLPDLNKALGVYIPLIVVNCIILGRAESYAYSNPPLPSLFDGIGMGLGFSFALTCIGAVRELLGTGKVFDIQIMPDSFTPIGIFVLAPGAFFVLAALTAIQNYIKLRGEKKGKDMSKVGSGCSHDCMNCGQSGCAERFYDADAKPAEKKQEKADAKPAEKKQEKAPAKPVEKKTEKAPAKPVEKKTEKAPAKPVEKKQEKAPAKPVEKKQEKAPAKPVEKKKEKVPVKQDTKRQEKEDK